MPSVIEGHVDAKGMTFAVVVSRFNNAITEQLLAGALDALQRNGAADADITVIRVPGAFELPSVVRQVARQKKHDAVIALGAVIRGETPHFDYIAAEVTKGIAQAGFDAEASVVYGVLTTDTVEQAIDRAGAKAGNKGADAARAAIEMVDLKRRLVAVG